MAVHRTAFAALPELALQQAREMAGGVPLPTWLASLIQAEHARRQREAKRQRDIRERRAAAKTTSRAAPGASTRARRAKR